jgi:hypothetical protein
MVEDFPSKCEALSSNPSPTKKQNRKKERKQKASGFCRPHLFLTTIYPLFWEKLTISLKQRPVKDGEGRALVKIL